MKLIIYRIFSFLLLPIAILFGMSVPVLLGIALTYPILLFPLFLVVCIVIYSFVSLNFLIKGIDGKKFLGRSSKEWLKANAFVSMIFAVLLIIECTMFLVHPEILTEAIAQTKQSTPDLPFNNMAAESNSRTFFLFFLIYAIVLFVHILISFQYIKLYNYLFQNKKQ